MNSTARETSQHLIAHLIVSKESRDSSAITFVSPGSWLILLVQLKMTAGPSRPMVCPLKGEDAL